MARLTAQGAAAAGTAAVEEQFGKVGRAGDGHGDGVVLELLDYYQTGPGLATEQVRSRPVMHLPYRDHNTKMLSHLGWGLQERFDESYVLSFWPPLAPVADDDDGDEGPPAIELVRGSRAQGTWQAGCLHEAVVNWDGVGRLLCMVFPQHCADELPPALLLRLLLLMLRAEDAEMVGLPGSLGHTEDDVTGLAVRCNRARRFSRCEATQCWDVGFWLTCILAVLALFL